MVLCTAALRKVRIAADYGHQLILAMSLTNCFESDIVARVLKSGQP